MRDRRLLRALQHRAVPGHQVGAAVSDNESSPAVAPLRQFAQRRARRGLRQTEAVAETHDRATPPQGAPEVPPHRRSHTRARDLERYASLFAERTRVMRSSAMRDLMEITARPEVISLAGGLPDTSTFPPESFAAQMTRIAQESSAQALQYGPTEGFVETKECIREVMRGGGHGSRPRRRDRDHRRPAGDRPRRQDPGRPRRHRDRRGAHLSGRGTRLLLVPGGDPAGGDRRGGDARRRARAAARAARAAPVGGRSSSIRCRAFRTRPG